MILVELEWVLRGAYQLPRSAVIHAFEALMAISHLHVEQEELVLRALEWHQQGLDFAAALHLVRSEGCGALVSFDRALVRAAAELQLTPAVRTP